jgi:hypothetical protein
VSVDGFAEKAAMTSALMDAKEALNPIFDMADGMRRDLEQRGWSPAMAEHLAGVWLQNALAAAWAVAKS